MVLFFLVQQSWRLRFFFEIVEGGKQLSFQKLHEVETEDGITPQVKFTKAFFGSPSCSVLIFSVEEPIMLLTR